MLMSRAVASVTQGRSLAELPRPICQGHGGISPRVAVRTRPSQSVVTYRRSARPSLALRRTVGSTWSADTRAGMPSILARRSSVPVTPSCSHSIVCSTHPGSGRRKQGQGQPARRAQESSRIEELRPRSRAPTGGPVEHLVARPGRAVHEPADRDRRSVPPWPPSTPGEEMVHRARRPCRGSRASQPRRLMRARRVAHPSRCPTDSTSRRHGPTAVTQPPAPHDPHRRATHEQAQEPRHLPT